MARALSPATAVQAIDCHAGESRYPVSGLLQFRTLDPGFRRDD